MTSYRHTHTQYSLFIYYIHFEAGIIWDSFLTGDTEEVQFSSMETGLIATKIALDWSLVYWQPVQLKSIVLFCAKNYGACSIDLFQGPFFLQAVLSFGRICVTSEKCFNLRWLSIKIRVLKKREGRIFHAKLVNVSLCYTNFSWFILKLSGFANPAGGLRCHY